MWRHVIVLAVVAAAMFLGTASAELRFRKSVPFTSLSADTTNYTGPQVDVFPLLESVLLGSLPNETEVKIIAATLGSIVVYVFSYMFMGVVFTFYLAGVIVLLILKIMFTGFIPAEVVTTYDGSPSARVLEPYAGGKNINFENHELNLYDKTAALVNRGYATGMYLYDVLSAPECQKFIVCQAAAAFGEEDANEITFKDALRQASY